RDRSFPVRLPALAASTRVRGASDFTSIKTPYVTAPTAAIRTTAPAIAPAMPTTPSARRMPLYPSIAIARSLDALDCSATSRRPGGLREAGRRCRPPQGSSGRIGALPRLHRSARRWPSRLPCRADVGPYALRVAKPRLEVGNGGFRQLNPRRLARTLPFGAVDKAIERCLGIVDAPVDRAAIAALVAQHLLNALDECCALALGQGGDVAGMHLFTRRRLGNPTRGLLRGTAL